MKTLNGKEVKVGFFAGAFDPFCHPGHLLAMRQAIAAKACDTIWLALDVDPSRERPEKRPPILSVEERVDMLTAIRYVSRIELYWSLENLVELLEKWQPDVRILGDDYKGKPFAGDHLNIPIFWAERVPGWSSTEFVRRIRECNAVTS